MKQYIKDFLRKFISLILRLEAGIVLWKYKPKIVAITGTVGKTTTKTILEYGLKDEINLRASPKGYNSDIGVPLTILGLTTQKVSVFAWIKNILLGIKVIFNKKYPKILILEIGANYKNEIKRNAKLIQADIVILTRLPKTMAHMEFFQNRQEFVKEKLSLVKFMKKDGVIFYNNDDDSIVSEIKNFKQQKISFGFQKTSEIQIKNSEINKDEEQFPIGMNFLIKYNQQEFSFFLRGILGDSFSYPLAVLLGISKYLNINISSQKLTQNFIPAPGRLRIIKGKRNTLIIDDSYNAIPISVKNGINVLKKLDWKYRKIYVLGRIAEMGEKTREAYVEALEYIGSNVDVLLLVNTHKYVPELIKNDYKKIFVFDKETNFLDNTEKAGEFLNEFIRDNDLLIFKGSRHSTGLERAIQYISFKEERKKLVQDYIL